MATSMITSPLVAPARAKGLPSISRRGSSFAIVCSGGKKIKTDKPYGIGGGMSVDIDASGRKSTVRTCPQLLNFSMGRVCTNSLTSTAQTSTATAQSTRRRNGLPPVTPTLVEPPGF
ncbi:photosystem II 10 kDa polypeptide, chloroplastic isoform X2 [Oryza sativa Japonica Group]|uniref:photosystem II 10 kDa polypeptide, chloroplastic isoform X2 n=1 Tax=Oryza sativa subsp. japonica TaxID=39947 RepID=UPI0001C7B817|nr:photosystem II 10 kDa polypeptide, chloroplastic isoform X2 [Oryza sativa Japonica Group]